MDSDLLDPFRTARQGSGVLVGDFDGETIPMLLRLKDVRAAARDTQGFSSDAPFRVPIPSEETVRSVRQLPIETDPPLHTSYRAIVSPLFMRAAKPDYLALVESLVAHALAEVATGQPVELVSGFSRPLQCRGLALLLNVPSPEAETWIGWGDHVFKDEGGLNPEKGRAFEAYLDGAFARAHQFPTGNLFSLLLEASFEGRALTREERLGFANLAFAGGRDTVITALTAAMLHFSQHPELLARLKEEPRLIAPAVEELVRFITPITHLARICPDGARLEDADVAPGGRVSLCWASANRDESAFERPHDYVIDRNPNPHVGFGSGAHICLGAAHARALLRTLLRQLSTAALRMDVLEVRPSIKSWPHYSRHVGYESALMKIVPA